MKKCIILLGYLLSSSLLCARVMTEFSYDLANYAAQQGKWNKAQEALSSLLVDAHDRADILYDTGVTSYQTGDFSQARAYFSRAVEDNNTSDQLKVQAYFNGGNSCVALNELEGAVEYYEKSLKIDPENEHVKHNLERVKQMLEQQQQQKQQNQQRSQQQQDNQSSSQDDQNQKDNEQEQDSQHEEQKGEDQSNNQNDQQSNGKKAQQKSRGGHDNHRSKKDSSQNRKDHKDQKTSRGTEGNERKDEREQEQNARQHHNDEQWDREHDPQNKFHNTQSNQQQNKRQDRHTTPTSEKDQETPHPQDTNNQEKKQSMTAKKAGMPQINGDVSNAVQDPWLAYVLKKQEEKDKKVNKHLMEAKIKAHCAGEDGQNCW